MRRMPFASRETEYVASKSTGNLVKVYSFFPVDRADCDCQKMIIDWKKKLAMENDQQRKKIVSEQKFLECPRSKFGATRYKVTCRKCGAIQGYCWASTPDLLDWFDFHYVQWTKGDYWRGCFTPHISPITQKLCFECACGNDTRDFRANMTKSTAFVERKEAEAEIGRDFNKSNSKFIVSPAGKVVI